MRSDILWVLSLLLCAVVSFFCAGQVAPSGGPVDKTPPEILTSYPAPRSLDFHDSKFSLTFSKYVDKRSVEESIFISPSLGALTFEWGSTDVEAHFADSLRRNTTYVITIGTDIVDTRNRNRMAKAFALPFSTGDHIDSASISGKVFDGTPEGIMIFAYRVSAHSRDTLNPIHARPDYLTQTGKGGTFVLPYLALGGYRLIAVRDEFKNLLYDRETDQYGVPSADYVLDDTLSRLAGIQFLLTSEDTTPPFLSSAKPLDRSHTLLRFSEPIDGSSLQLRNVTVLDTVSGKTLPVYDVSFTGAFPLETQLVTAPQESTALYRVIVTETRDASGNLMRGSGNSALLTGTGLADTTKPVFLMTSVSDSGRRLSVADTMHFLFSEAVQRSKFAHGFQLRDSSGNAVPGDFIWRNSAEVSFLPSRRLLWNARYAVTLILDSLTDWSGNGIRDSIRVFPFRTIDEKVFGTIKGIIIDEVSNAAGRIIIDLKDVTNKNGKLRRESFDKPGPFELAHVMEGKYSLFAFRDADSNGVYSPGRVFPFVPSERFVSYEDTLKVRARWSVEGVTIRFK